MLNKPKGYRTLDAALGVLLLGLAVLLLLALVSYQPSDLPSWAKLIYDSNIRSPIVHNLCGVVGAVVAGYLYFFFGAASYLWIIVLAGYGIAKLTTRNFFIRERVGWSFLFVLSGACLVQLQPWFLKGWNKAFHIEGPGGWLGKWVGERALGGPLGDVGAPVVLGIVYLTSLVLAIGFHPIHVLRNGWAGIKRYFAEREKRRIAAWKRASEWILKSASSHDRPKSLSASSKRRGIRVNAGPRSRPRLICPSRGSSTPPSPRKGVHRWRNLRAEGGKKAKSKPSLAALRLENYQLPPLDLLEPTR